MGRKYETPEKRKDWALRTNYGITLSQYEEMYSKQNGRCLFCDKAEKLFVDHCHKTGAVRGLLCNNCNLMLGHAKDSPALLRIAATYLDNYDRSINSTKEFSAAVLG